MWVNAIESSSTRELLIGIRVNNFTNADMRSYKLSKLFSLMSLYSRFSYLFKV